MPYFPKFAAHLEELLHRSDRSPSWLAQRLGVHRSTVGRWLNDATRPNSPEDVVRIADLLGARGQVQPLLAAAGYGVSVTSGEREPEPVQSRRAALPPLPTRLIGREKERALLQGYITDPRIRLITLLGVGGVGKSSLALTMAHQLVADFADGAYFVPLAEVQEGADIASAICDVLGVRVQADLPVATHLCATLADQEILLVLDNFEHLLDGADLLAELLAAAPGITLLVTSRARLSLRQEWTVDLHGLAFPSSAAATAHSVNSERDTERDIDIYIDGSDIPEPGMPEEFDHAGPRLLTQLIRQHRAGFAVNGNNRAWIEALCRFVEGNPLALEMIAPWARTLSLKKIWDLLSSSADQLLVSAARNVSDRHRSMVAVLDQSWALLGQDEQQALARLSVFRGGCRPEEAQAVTAAPLATFAALIDRSLLTRAPGGRYHLHDLVRQYAAQKLAADSQGTDRFQSVHAQVYASFLHQREADLLGPNQARALSEIQAEIDNIRGLWSWALSTAKYDKMVAALGLALHGFFYFCEVRGYALEGAQLLQGAIDRLQLLEQKQDGLHDEQLVLVGRRLGRRGWLMARMGETYDSVLAQMDEGVARLQASAQDTRWEQLFILRYSTTPTQMVRSAHQLEAVLTSCERLSAEVADPGIQKEVLYSIGQVRQFQGRFAEACDIFAGLQPFFKERANRRRLAFVHSNWGRSLLGMGERDQAAVHFEEAHIIREELHDPIGIGFSQIDWGRWWEATGDFGEAIERLHRALHLVETHRQSYLIALCHQALGDLYRITADRQRAILHYQESSAIHRSRHNRLIQAGNLNGFGLLALEQGDLTTAASYFGQSLDACEEQGSLGTGAGAAIGLARCGFQRGEPSTGWSYLHKAWAWAKEAGAVPMALYGLAVAAQTLSSPAQEHLRTQIAQHPALSAETRKTFKLNGPSATAPTVPEMDVWEAISKIRDNEHR